MAERAYGAWLVALRALVLVAGSLPWALALIPGASRAVAPALVLLCHQLPERTLSFRGEAMIVCSRCAGLYGAAALGALFALPRAWLRRGPVLVAVAVASAVIDVVLQDTGVHPPWHPTRLATGAAIGWTASAFMFGWLAKERDARRDPSARPAS